MPDWVPRGVPEARDPGARRLGDARTRRCCRSSSTGSARSATMSTVVRRSRASAISRRGKRREQVADALAPFLAVQRDGYRRGHVQRHPIPLALRRPARRGAGAVPAGDGGHAARRACSTNSTSTGSARRSRTRTYADAEVDFFDDLVTGADARRAEIDALIADRLAEGLEPRAARPADARDPARRRL